MASDRVDALKQIGAEACQVLVEATELMRAITTIREVAMGHKVDKATKAALDRAHEDAMDDAISAVLMWRTARMVLRDAVGATAPCRHMGPARDRKAGKWTCGECGMVLKDGIGWVQP
jgi:hypothetical protein